MKIQSGPAANDEHALTLEQRQVRAKLLAGIDDAEENRRVAMRLLLGMLAIWAAAVVIGFGGQLLGLWH